MQVTKSKTLLTESFPQRLLGISTALSPFYVEQPHDKVSALYNPPKNCCKNNLESSTDPNVINFTKRLSINVSYELNSI